MKKIYYSIGLMSGTSLDGVDLAYIRFTGEKQYEILQAQTYPYSFFWQQKLKNAYSKKPTELKKLDLEYGKFLGELVLKFTKEFEIVEVDFIASHGHTIFHKPEQGYTLQIGSGEEISKIMKCKVVYDFRTQDVALGGQGAPLVPIGDALLFSNYDACINLGGFANISFQSNEKRIAFDICPVNIVLNHFSNQLGKPYDEDGAIAASGKIDEALLNQLEKHEFYKKAAPKSLGYEFVIDEVFPTIDSFALPSETIIATYTEHIAQQISNSITQKKCFNVLVTGGGAYNHFLIQRINSLIENQLVIPNEKLLEFKEALVFALLGKLRLEEQINCLSSVTGASRNHSSGKIANP